MTTGKNNRLHELLEKLLAETENGKEFIPNPEVCKQVLHDIADEEYLLLQKLIEAANNLTNKLHDKFAVFLLSSLVAEEFPDIACHIDFSKVIEFSVLNNTISLLNQTNSAVYNNITEAVAQVEHMLEDLKKFQARRLN